MSTAILCELKKLLHNAAFCLFGALLLAAGAFCLAVYLVYLAAVLLAPVAGA